MQRHHAHRNRNKFRRRPAPSVVQSLVAGAQAHPGAAAVLRAVFVADERAYTGARCELPLGEVVEVTGRKTPFFALCREMDARGYGDCRIEISTPAGTPSMRAVVRAAAGLTIKERDRGGLRLDCFQEFPGLTTDAQVELEGIRGPETPDRAPGPDRATGEAA